MRLLTVGDSFTYGDELINLSDAWPYQLGERLGYTVNNLGMPGASNNYMVRTVLEQSNSADIIVIAWSHFARMEVADEYGKFEIWPGANEAIHNQLPHRKELLNYINRYHDDRYSYMQHLVNIVLIQNYLKANNKKYLMATAFCDRQLVNRLMGFPDIKNMAGQVDHRYFLGWPDITMMEWTYGTPQGPRGHFLKEGHAIVADKIYEYIGNLGWLS